MEDQNKNINKMVKISSVSLIRQSISKSYKIEKRNEILDNKLNNKKKETNLKYKLVKLNKYKSLSNDIYKKNSNYDKSGNIKSKN